MAANPDPNADTNSTNREFNALERSTDHNEFEWLKLALINFHGPYVLHCNDAHVKCGGRN